jgi:hypothetical protein
MQNSKSDGSLLPSIFGGPRGDFYQVYVPNPQYNRASWGRFKAYYRLPEETRKQLRETFLADQKRLHEYSKANGIKLRDYRSEDAAKKVLTSVAEALPGVRLEVLKYGYL